MLFRCLIDIVEGPFEGIAIGDIPGGSTVCYRVNSNQTGKGAVSMGLNPYRSVFF